MTEAEWSPEGEKADDKIQREVLKLAHEQLLKQKEESLKREQEEASQPPPIKGFMEDPYPAPAQGFMAYKPPTFEETSENCKKAWEETKKIAQDAPDSIKSVIFNDLRFARIGGTPHGGMVPGGMIGAGPV